MRGALEGIRGGRAGAQGQGGDSSLDLWAWEGAGTKGDGWCEKSLGVL